MTVKLRATSATYFIFSGLLGIPVAIWIFTACVKPRRCDPTLGILSIALLGFVLLYFFSLQIELLEDRLIYKVIFFSRVVHLSALRRVEFNVQQFARGITPVIELYDDTRYCKKPLRIPIKPFSRSDLQHLASILMQKAPAAKFNERFKSLSDFGRL